jgi:gp16 family phage-associated protein
MEIQCRKLEEIRLKFELRGQTISSWAAAHGFERDSVYAVLSGRVQGKHGKSHDIAVALGLKVNPKDLLSGGPKNDF